MYIYVNSVFASLNLLEWPNPFILFFLSKENKGAIPCFIEICKYWQKFLQIYLNRSMNCVCLNNVRIRELFSKIPFFGIFSI